MDPKNLRSLLLTSDLPETAPGRDLLLPTPEPESPTLPEPNPLAEALLDSTAMEVEPAIPEGMRTQMSQMLGTALGAALGGTETYAAYNLSSIPGAGAQPVGSPVSGVPSQFSSLLPALIAIKSEILQELEYNLPKLLQLNPSRRETVAQYLDRLAGHPPGPSSLHGSTDAAGGLRRWIEGPRSPQQNSALQSYFEEVSLIVLGQAVLLKAWSDRGLRAWNESDLGRLNWALSTTLRPHVPLDREGWTITRPNIYSWYNPSTMIQKELWAVLETCRITDEGPSLLTFLLGPSRQARPQTWEPQGYDARFFKAIWENLAAFGLNPSHDTGPLRRQKTVFSPTLRDGSMVRTGPVSVGWIGLESSAFQLMAAELVQLWWGPAPPPLWAIGSGLEVHARDQLALALGSPKPSLLSRITEMEACEAAFVLEERIVRGQGRGLEAQRLREQLDSLPYFKKLRAPGTSLGDLQACVALSKLRPGGFLWWAREEPLSANDGSEMLSFLLERARLVCEWDFSELEHSLPSAVPLFPKHLYLLVREPRVEERLTYRPLRLALQGQIRSHVELPLFLQDSLEAAVHALSGRPAREPNARAHWQVHAHRSPLTQKDWMERWPDPASQSVLRSLEKLRNVSLPLASAATVRPTPEGDPSRDHAWSVHASLKGFWMRAENGADGRRLLTDPLPRAGRDSKGSGILVLVPDESWVAPLRSFLESAPARSWLEHHAERRGDRWILNEQTAKFIPVPRILLRCLGAPCAIENDAEAAAFALPLPGEWEKLAAEIGHNPKAVRDALERLPADPADPATEGAREIRASVFIRAARALEHLTHGQNRLMSVVTADGRIRWRELLDILPKSECTPISVHPKVRLSGQIPPYVPIGRIDRIKAPSPGILMTTEIGLSLQILSDTALIVDMLWEQLEGLTHPTWSELVQYLKLPRRLEIAEATASDVLRSHGEQSQRLRELTELLSACPLF